jgi:hypothetical protein
MATERRKGSRRGSERKGSGELQQGEPRETGAKAPRAESKNERRRREKEEFLRPYGRYEEETYFLENSQRPKLPD